MYISGMYQSEYHVGRTRIRILMTDLSGARCRLTDWGVCRLARGCNRLRYIDLAGDALLTDLSVFELATNCPKLKRVGLVKVSPRLDPPLG